MDQPPIENVQMAMAALIRHFWMNPLYDVAFWQNGLTVHRIGAGGESKAVVSIGQKRLVKGDAASASFVVRQRKVSAAACCYVDLITDLPAAVEKLLAPKGGA